jgi:SpoVK/Ycf46/Vps4 family AAA+-type ATPase
VSASAEHIKALVKSHVARDDEQFKAVALQVAAKAARQGHHRLADDLKQLIETERRSNRTVVTPITKPRGDLADLVSATFPEVGLEDLVISKPVAAQLQQVIAEQRQRHLLAEQGFAPIHRILIDGPPGTGKTMTASVLAHELGLPLVTVQLETVYSKFLGETASKIRALFDAIASQRAVYLFDEFDALGADRSGNDVGEARRILNTFLVLLENASVDSLVIAATNFRGLLDRALFRRFDLVVTYELPSPDEATAVMKARLGRLGSGIEWRRVKAMVSGLSHAELVHSAEAAAKRSLLGGLSQVPTAVLIDCIRERGAANGA